MMRSKKLLPFPSLPLLFLASLALVLLVQPVVYADPSAPESAEATEGAAWEWELIGQSESGTNFTLAPALAVAADGKLLVAYNAMRQGVQNPFYSESTDDGLTWSAPQPIRISSSDLRQVDVAYDRNSQAHAVWRSESHVQHAVQQQWPSGATTLPGNGERLVDPPQIAIGPDNVVHVVWAQGNNLQAINHSFSSDGGAHWSTPVELATTARDSHVPVVAVDASNNVHVVWEERFFNIPTYNFEIHYRKGTPSGSGYSWSAAVVLSPGLTTAKRPSIYAEGNTLHVTYARQASTDEQYAYYTRFQPGGGWSSPRDVTRGNPVGVNTTNPFNLNSTVASCEGIVYLYYHGSTDNNAREQIWAVQNDGSWSAPHAITADTERNIYPSFVCSGSIPHLTMEQIVQPVEDHRVLYGQRNNSLFLPLIYKR